MPQKAFVCATCFKTVWVDFDHQGLDAHMVEDPKKKMAGLTGFRYVCGYFDEPEIWQKQLV